jgi:hypothetical protein
MLRTFCFLSISQATTESVCCVKNIYLFEIHIASMGPQKNGKGFSTNITYEPHNAYTCHYFHVKHG